MIYTQASSIDQTEKKNLVQWDIGRDLYTFNV